MTLCDSDSGKETHDATLSRSAMRRRLNRRSQCAERLNSKNDELQQQVQDLQKCLGDNLRKHKMVNAQLAMQSSAEPSHEVPLFQRERPLAGHQFGLVLIAVSIELAKRVGFRAAADVLRIVFEMLDIEMKIPSHDAIEQWTLRLGVASLKDTFTRDDRVLWMVDHSSQIGKERLLVIVGVGLDDLPPPGQTLGFNKMKVLALVPGQSWKKEDVAREYLQLASKIGPPVYLLSDGASELRDPAEKLEKDGEKTIILGDLKHHAANVLEKEIGRGERFKSFTTEVGLTRNRVQQTELDQFAPPTLRSKSRFMNVGKLFEWAMMVLYHLDHASVCTEGIRDERMEEKLGWVREYADDLASWNQCQKVIDQSLRVINTMGLEKRTPKLAEDALDKLNPSWRQDDSSAARIGVKLIAWIEQSASKLKTGERAWLSTEILESLFGKFKQMERQHSKGGFTRLIAAIPTLCLRVTREQVRHAFGRIDSKATRQWIKTTLGKTLTARRNAAYREFQCKTPDHEFLAA